MPDRDELILEYLSQLPYEPYPVQEQALMRWAETDQGVLMCAPTGTGKTLVAEAAMYEALHTGKVAYYTTPLIALTEQKFEELSNSAERWGFPRSSVGLVTGNRSVNPDAIVRVVVAEVLLNRLLHPEAFSFDKVGAVVMDEFHSFNDPQRGIVWELSLSLLPKHVRLMLLSATVGNAYDFTAWLRRAHGRDIDLVQGNDRKVPLTFHWVGDELLPDQLARMSQGEGDGRYTPALVFCFDREQCWDVAEQLRGRDVLAEGQQKLLAEQIDQLDLSHGGGPKLKRLLLRGIGVHHAGLLPRYRRIVEELFQEKLLSVCVCTETLAAGMNLPARSVLLTSLVKGPPRKKKLLEASGAHQMFGRAGRPQYDTEGHVFALAHEDDVRIAKHKLKVAQIPADTKDPKLMKKRKQMEKKTPRRREGVSYWSEAQFEKLRDAPAGKLESKGRLPWRLLAFLLDATPDLTPVRDAVSKRLLPPNLIESQQKLLTRMLVTLHDGGFVTLDPPPPGESTSKNKGSGDDNEDAPPPSAADMLASLTLGTGISDAPATPPPADNDDADNHTDDAGSARLADYDPQHAHRTDKLDTLLQFRAVNPVYGAYLLEHLGLADADEQLQILESVLEMPNSVARRVRVPRPEVMPPGSLALEVIDVALIQRGLATQDELYPGNDEQDNLHGQPRRFAIPLAEKVQMLFDAQVDCGGHNPVRAVWAAGDLLNNFNGDFIKFISARDLQRQEGVIFRHLLRLILLCDEFSQQTPAGLLRDAWVDRLDDWASRLTESCRAVDAHSTDKMLDQARREQENPSDDA
ncbi:MAG: DEAD/DEAH box helicase [Phycisphaerales bacterium JB063]